jgi:hypothetical protein
VSSSGRTKMRETRQVQSHHVSYSAERTILIFKGEHYILSLLNRMKKPPSIAFFDELYIWRDRMFAF